MNKIEELEDRCRQLENRVEALEKALVAALARPCPPVVRIEKVEPARPEMWVFDGVTWYGGQ